MLFSSFVYLFRHLNERSENRDFIDIQQAIWRIETKDGTIYCILILTIFSSYSRMQTGSKILRICLLTRSRIRQIAAQSIQTCLFIKSARSVTNCLMSTALSLSLSFSLFLHLEQTTSFPPLIVYHLTRCRVHRWVGTYQHLSLPLLSLSMQSSYSLWLLSPTTTTKEESLVCPVSLPWRLVLFVVALYPLICHTWTSSRRTPFLFHPTNMTWKRFYWILIPITINMTSCSLLYALPSLSISRLSSTLLFQIRP